MATELIPIGTGFAESDPFDLADGETAHVFLKGSSVGASCSILVETDEGTWTKIGDISNPSKLSQVIAGAGTYMLIREDGAECGASLG